MSDQLLELLLGQVWQVTILAVIVGWLTRTVLRNYPEWSYQLWLVVMVKCITPPIWASHCGVFSWLFQRLANFSAAVTQFTFGEVVPPRNIAFGLLSTWMMGAFISIAVTIFKWQRIQQRITEHQLTVSSELQTTVQRLARELGIRRTVRIVVTEDTIGPAVIGVWQPILILPRALLGEQTTTEDLEPILAHELLHVRRGDTWAAMLETIVRAVWWFHPQIQRAADSLSQAGELCCDQDVLLHADFSPRQYADSLLQVLEVRCRLQPLLTQPGIRQEQLTRKRLKRIMTWDRKQTPSMLKILSLLLALLVILPGRSV